MNTKEKEILIITVENGKPVFKCISYSEYIKKLLMENDNVN